MAQKGMRCLWAWVELPVCVGTFGSSQHGGGQFTLLGLYMAESEPAGEAAGHH